MCSLPNMSPRRPTIGVRDRRAQQVSGQDPGHRGGRGVQLVLDVGQGGRDERLQGWRTCPRPGPGRRTSGRSAGGGGRREVVMSARDVIKRSTRLAAACRRLRWTVADVATPRPAAGRCSRPPMRCSTSAATTPRPWREIGERAGVDAALIARYFDSKEGLYLATLQQEARPEMPTDPVQAFAAMLAKSERGIGPVPLAMVEPDADRRHPRPGPRDHRAARRRAARAPNLAARGTPDPELRVEVLRGDGPRPVAHARGRHAADAGSRRPWMAVARRARSRLIDALAAPTPA